VTGNNAVANLAPIDNKLAKKVADIVRRLTSNQPGEVANTIEALGRVLQNAGADVIHCIANRIEHHNRLTEAEMKAIFDAGVVAGRSQARQQLHVNGAVFPSAHEMALWCRQQDDRLRPKEREFLNDVSARTLWRSPTLRQEEWLKAIFLRLGGEMLQS
jgi:hypothetical protein